MNFVSIGIQSPPGLSPQMTLPCHIVVCYLASCEYLLIVITINITLVITIPDLPKDQAHTPHAYVLYCIVLYCIVLY